jgi:hypothetical protein
MQKSFQLLQRQRPEYEESRDADNKKRTLTYKFSLFIAVLIYSTSWEKLLISDIRIQKFITASYIGLKGNS